MTAKDTAGVIAPPPLIFLAGLIAGFLLDHFLAWPGMTTQVAAGLALLGLGLILMFLGIREFERAGTDYRPYKPTTRIITGGPFRFTRNPLYLSLALIYAGLALAHGSFWALVLLGPVLIVIRYGVIAREERYLEARFGADYLNYKNSVRRWL